MRLFLFVVGERKIALFDSRIHNFSYVTSMPHLNWTTFKGGIMQFATRSKKEKLQATGSFGGFRSSSFISALFQIYYAIGFNNDILPNDHRHRRIQEQTYFDVNRVRSKVQIAIETILDVYFDCKRKEWNPDTLDIFQSKLHLMEVHLTLVWELKQALVNPDASKLNNHKMRNLHKHVHLPMYIGNYGSLIHTDTSTFESFHKTATTGIWRKTSKRHNGLFQEMINGIMQYDFNNLLTTAHQIATNGSSYGKEAENIVDGVKFQRIMSTSKFPFNMSFDNSNFTISIAENEKNEVHVNYWKTVSLHSAVNSRTKFRDILFKHNVGDEIAHSYSSIAWNKEFEVKYRTHIIQGISYVSDEESQMGKGCIYATAKYNRNTDDESEGRPRHDFVLLQFEGADAPTLARILLFFTIDKVSDEGDNEDSKIMLLSQLLVLDEKSSLTLGFGQVFEWAAGQTPKSFSYAIVPVESIIRPVFVVPIFREGYSELNPNYHDRFIGLDRVFL